MIYRKIERNVSRIEVISNDRDIDESCRRDTNYYQSILTLETSIELACLDEKPIKIFGFVVVESYEPNETKMLRATVFRIIEARSFFLLLYRI